MAIANGIEVRRVKNQLYPCVNCRYRHNRRFPATLIHVTQQDTVNILSSFNGCTGFAGAQLIGTCNDYMSK
jgi:hypothetical protein